MRLIQFKSSDSRIFNELKIIKFYGIIIVLLLSENILFLVDYVSFSETHSPLLLISAPEIKLNNSREIIKKKVGKNLFLYRSL